MASNLYLYLGTITDGIFTIAVDYSGLGPIYSVGQDDAEDGILQPEDNFDFLLSGNPFPATYLGAVPDGLAFTVGGTPYILIGEEGLPVSTQLVVSAVDYVLSDPPCFLAGTRIETARGQVAVEHLVEGDQLMTLSGRLAPLTWIGHRKVSARFAMAKPEKSLPVRFAAEALAPGLPVRDLWLSPDHCLHHDGVLVQAKELVNGSTVTQEDPGCGITYYHLLLDRHEVVFAEGAASETYRPCNNIFGFHNAETFPRHVARNQPRSTGCFPVKKSGAKVEALKALLAARAADLAEDLSAVAQNVAA